MCVCDGLGVGDVATVGVGVGATLGSFVFDGGDGGMEEEDGCGGATIEEFCFGAIDGEGEKSGEFICSMLGGCTFGCDGSGLE